MPVSSPFTVGQLKTSKPRGSNAIAFRCLAAAILSAVFLNLAYFPTNQGWVAWFALVPGLVLVRADLRNRDRYLLAWLSTWLFFLPALRWMRVAHESMYFSWIGLSLWCSWFAPLALWLVRRLDRRGWPLTLSVPIVWTALEFIRTHILGGFPWYLLGHSQHDWLSVIQIADLAGVPAVTFLVAAVNGLLAEWLFRVATVRSWFGFGERSGPLIAQSVVVLASIALVLGYGAWRLSQNQFADGPVVALLQTDLDQDIRNSRPDDPGAGTRSVQDLRVQTMQLTKQALQLPRSPDLIIWPETTFEYDLKEPRIPPPADAQYQEWAKDMADRLAYLQDVARASRFPVLLGANAQVYAGPNRIHRYNCALLVSASGDILGRYDKTHLVPFGEYVPLLETFPFLAGLSPYSSSEELNLLTPGEKYPTLQVAVDGRAYSFGCLICYESAYAHLARKYMNAPNNPADFLVNQSNDGWFRCTQEHEQHLAVARFRAIECRRALVRAVNMGISAVIDGNGRVVALPGPTWEKSKGLMAVVSAPIPIDTRTSVYAKAGDWLSWLCWIGIAVGIVRGRKDRAA
jgi:apolipoprotein N-acyltransferase